MPDGAVRLEAMNPVFIVTGQRAAGHTSESSQT